MKKISYKKLFSFTQKSLSEVGVNKFSANSVAIGLCNTSLRWVDFNIANVDVIEKYSIQKFCFFIFK